LVISLFKTELHHSPAVLAEVGGHWRGPHDLEVATSQWVYEPSRRRRGGRGYGWAAHNHGCCGDRVTGVGIMGLQKREIERCCRVSRHCPLDRLRAHRGCVRVQLDAHRIGAGCPVAVLDHATEIKVAGHWLWRCPWASWYGRDARIWLCRRPCRMPGARERCAIPVIPSTGSGQVASIGVVGDQVERDGLARPGVRWRHRNLPGDRPIGRR
jgi:hypothetical protein